MGHWDVLFLLVDVLETLGDVSSEGLGNDTIGRSISRINVHTFDHVLMGLDSVGECSVMIFNF